MFSSFVAPHKHVLLSRRERGEEKRAGVGLFVVGRMVSANFIKESKSAKHHKRSMMKSYKASHPKRKTIAMLSKKARKLRVTDMSQQAVSKPRQLTTV